VNAGDHKGGKTLSAAAEVWRNDRIWLALVLLLALALRISAVFYLSNFDRITGYENEEIAQNLLAGKGYSMHLFGSHVVTAHQYPVYTFFLAAHFFLFGKNYLFVELSQALIGSVSCVLLFFLGRAMFDRDTGALSALGCALYPTYVYWTARAQALTLEIFLFILILLALRRAILNQSLKSWALAGVICGMGVLSKTLYLAFTPAYLLWAWSLGNYSARKLAGRGALFVLAMLAVIFPWTLRNWIALDSFVLVSSNDGCNLWIGHNPHSTGTLFTEDGRHMFAKIDKDMQARLSKSSDVEKNRIFQERAEKYIKGHPLRSITIIPKKLLYLWWFDPYMPSDYPLLRKIVYLFLLVPAAAGIVLAIPRWRRVSVFYGMFFIMSCVYSVYFGSPRFRYAIEFSLILFAAWFFVRVFNRYGFMPRAIERRRGGC